MDKDRATEAVVEEEPGPTQKPSTTSLGASEAGIIYQEIVHTSPWEAIWMEAGARGECVTLCLLRGETKTISADSANSAVNCWQWPTPRRC